MVDKIPVIIPPNIPYFEISSRLHCFSLFPIPSMIGTCKSTFLCSNTPITTAIISSIEVCNNVAILICRGVSSSSASIVSFETGSSIVNVDNIPDTPSTKRIIPRIRFCFVILFSPVVRCLPKSCLVSVNRGTLINSPSF